MIGLGMGAARRAMYAAEEGTAKAPRQPTAGAFIKNAGPKPVTGALQKPSRIVLGGAFRRVGQ